MQGGLEYKIKVCVIDDEPFIRDIYRVELERNGFEVRLAEDGQAGLALIKEEKPDIVLVDISMPKKDGIELMEELRANPETARLPIIVMSNLDDPETLKKVEKFNTSFYLVKAFFDPKKVVGIIREVLSGG